MLPVSLMDALVGKPRDQAPHRLTSVRNFVLAGERQLCPREFRLDVLEMRVVAETAAAARLLGEGPLAARLDHVRGGPRRGRCQREQSANVFDGSGPA